MNATDPTYYLFAGKLFHAVAFANGGGRPRRGEGASSSTTSPRRGEDPGPEGPVDEERDEDEEQAPPSSSEQGEGPGRGEASGRGEPAPPTSIAAEQGGADASARDPRASADERSIDAERSEAWTRWT